jgi:2-oxoglutarate dehydrogenase E1 component
VQEEPQNMGAWTFVRPRFEALLDAIHGRCEKPLGYAGRPAMASPATGSAKVHKREQKALVGDALNLNHPAHATETDVADAGAGQG